MLLCPVFSNITFDFGISTAYEKYLFVGMMSLNPSDIDPTSNILSQIISIYFFLYWVLSNTIFCLVSRKPVNNDIE